MEVREKVTYPTLSSYQMIKELTQKREMKLGGESQDKDLQTASIHNYVKVTEDHT